MWLDCGAHGLLRLNRITPTSVDALTPRDIPPCVADLVVTVDGVRVSNPVHLIAGFSKAARSAAILAIDPAAPFLPFAGAAASQT
jgi:hypothetical protein